MMFISSRGKFVVVVLLAGSPVQHAPVSIWLPSSFKTSRPDSMSQKKARNPFPSFQDVPRSQQSSYFSFQNFTKERVRKR